MNAPPRQPFPTQNPLRGVLWMLLATVFFSTMHGLIRHISADMHPLEIVFFRNLFGLVVVAPWFMRYGFTILKTGNLKLHLLRAVLNIVSMMSFFYALSLAPLADVTALTFAAPLFAPVLAAFFFGERAGAMRWAAILFGFAGAMVVLRPGFGDANIGLFLAAFAALVWAFALMVIKQLGRTDSTVTITSYMIVCLVPLSAIPAVFFWQWPTAEQFLWLLATGVSGTIGHLILNQAVKEAQASTVMPFDFLRLIWAVLIGYFVFAELPDAFTWVGGLMICASGIYIAYSERRRRR